MLIAQTLRFRRLLRITWKTDLLMLAMCGLAYLVDNLIFDDLLQVPANLPALLGTAIAFFIGFNNNQAYSRWWEARTVWGSLVNDSRSWARSVLAYLPGEANMKQAMVRRHIAFIYALRSSLRRSPDRSYEQYLSEAEAQKVRSFTNIPSAILDEQARCLQQFSALGYLDGFRFQELNRLLVSLCDNMGRSERINNTIFPATYIFFTRVCIWLFVLLTTLAMVDMAHGWSILFGSLLGFVFYVTHINGLSLMNPFEALPTGVPLDQISRMIEINLLQMLGDSNIPAPIEPINNEYVL